MNHMAAQRSQLQSNKQGLECESSEALEGPYCVETGS